MLANQIKPSAREEDTEENNLQAQRLAPEVQTLSEDDEDEQLRADLARPLSPAPTLDPFLPHQEYTRESLKPGIPGQIERLYRDINAMIDTLGINSRSLSAFLLYQKTPKDPDMQGWLDTLQGEQPGDILEMGLLLSEVDRLEQGVDALGTALQQGRVKNVQEKIEKCQKLLSTDLVTLRGQCANIRRTIDAHSDKTAIITAPLSAEQTTRQQELRQSSTVVQSKLAELEEGISLLRAKLADSSEPNSDINDPSKRKRPSMPKPTVEAVTSTIATMTSMAEKKSGDIDVLEAQLRRLGVDLSESAPSATREASPFLTPPSKRLGRLSRSPGSPCSRDGGTRSSYHTPEPAGSGSAFRSRVLGPGGKNQLGCSTRLSENVHPEDVERWKAKLSRRRVMVGHIKGALEHRKAKVRGIDEV
jgi:nucleoporin NUP159